MTYRTVPEVLHVLAHLSQVTHRVLLQTMLLYDICVLLLQAPNGFHLLSYQTI